MAISPSLLFIIILGTFNACNSSPLENKLHVYKGVKLQNSYRFLQLDSPVVCAANCMSDRTCIAANYDSKSKTCELNDKSPHEDSSVVVKGASWRILHIYNETWELIFRGNTGASLSIYSAYRGWTTLPEPDVGCLLSPIHNLDCTTHYRSTKIDRWTDQNISKVKVKLYKDGVVAVSMTFINPGTGTELDWFNNTYLIESSYADMLLATQTFNYFSIEGDNVLIRRFMIWKNYGGCNVDTGWMAVFESNACPYETAMSYSTIAYTSDNIMGLWSSNGFKVADSMAIFIKT